MKNKKLTKTEFTVRFVFPFLIIVLPLLFIPFVFSKFSSPSVQWDAGALFSVIDIQNGRFALNPYLIHPPLYLYLLAFFQNIIKADYLLSARIFNLLCYVFTSYVVYFLGKIMGGGSRKVGVMSMVFYLTSPFALQGIFLIDLADTSLVPFLAALFFVFYVKKPLLGWPARFLFLSMIFCLNLWSKFIHTFFIIVAFLSSALFNKLRRRNERMDIDLFSLFGGLAFFLLSWFFYSSVKLTPASRWLPFDYFLNEMVLGYHRRELLTSTFSMIIFSKLKEVIRILLWIWPLLLLWLFHVFKRKTFLNPLNLFALFLLMASFASKGTSQGFPKYHAVLIPLFSASAGTLLVSLVEGMGINRRIKLLIACAFFSSVFLFYFSGDIIYTFSYETRKVLIYGAGLNNVLVRFFLQMGAVLCLFGLLVFLFKKFYRKWDQNVLLIPVIICCLAWSISTSLIKAGGSYSSTYGYGTKGKMDAVEFIKKSYNYGKVFAPGEFKWELSSEKIPFYSPSDLCFQDKDNKCVKNWLKNKEISFFVFGLSTNTVEQIKGFLTISEKDISRKIKIVRKDDFFIYILD